ncbi:hypothetical protein OSC27_05395 [Microbacterium sp. STN6]|uniref:hypothetical protein n=1 Tax=Microbacterium sp. STN6 TaxID=2995588 RepID=UPI002260DD41|nr:hypothetical protein [Microbacterium sp. STN6]MCX7521713.1 hypothetical protein [Microbacterium sp. STN6]
MPRLIPCVLTETDLPLAELCAARMDGEVFAIDECFAAIDEVERSALRAGSLASLIPAHAIAESASALWVYGIDRLPPPRHTLCVPISRRARIAPSARWHVSERVIRESEIERIGELRIVTPMFAALDLLHRTDRFDAADVRRIRSLMRLGSFGAAECRALVEARSSIPGSRLARNRLDSLQAA